jgi:hypothetical protein
MYIWPFGIFYGHLVCNFLNLWYILWSFGTLYQEKSGNPAEKRFGSKRTFSKGSLLTEFTEDLNDAGAGLPDGLFSNQKSQFG